MELHSISAQSEIPALFTTAHRPKGRGWRSREINLEEVKVYLKTSITYWLIKVHEISISKTKLASPS